MNYMYPRLQSLTSDFIFQQDGAPSQLFKQREGILEQKGIQQMYRERWTGIVTYMLSRFDAL